MSRKLIPLFGTWLVLRVLFSVVAVVASTNRPQTELEHAIAPWPASSPTGAWAQRVFLDPWNRWDTEYYLEIATAGYRPDSGAVQFHPLFPLAGRIVAGVVGSPLLALLVVNSLCGLLFLILLERTAAFDLEAGTARRAAVFFLHFPGAFILFAPYSEGLFLLCSVLVFWFARRRSWWLAGVAGGLAALTRQQGVLLVVPLLWELWEWSGRDWRALVARWRSSLSVGLVPAGLLVWLAYRAAILGDVVFEWARPQTWVYGLLISERATQVVPDQRFVMPWTALAAALHDPQPTTVIDLVLGGALLTVFVAGGRFLWRLRPSYFLYAAVTLLVSFCYYTGAYQPYMGLSRHCLLAFPVFLPLAVWARKSVAEPLLIVFGLLGGALATYCYSAKILWVP